MFPTPKRRHDLVFWFSPHTRGCSHNIVCSRTHRLVFPAYAGMFRKSKPSWGEVGCFPRIRGDVPAEQVADQLQSGFSPHTRGCSLRISQVDSRLGVFPAYAGMFLHDHLKMLLIDSFPRIRGDVPAPFVTSYGQGQFSPHTRGCSELGYLAENL